MGAREQAGLRDSPGALRAVSGLRYGFASTAQTRSYKSRHGFGEPTKFWHRIAKARRRPLRVSMSPARLLTADMVPVLARTRCVAALSFMRDAGAIGDAELGLCKTQLLQVGGHGGDATTLVAGS